MLNILLEFDQDSWLGQARDLNIIMKLDQDPFNFKKYLNRAHFSTHPTCDLSRKCNPSSWFHP